VKEDGEDESKLFFRDQDILSILNVRRVVIITSDLLQIIDNVNALFMFKRPSTQFFYWNQELHEILVDPLPIGCFLLVSGAQLVVYFE